MTVVWEALAPDANNYSVFVHLASEDGLTIAQADTMPGGGLLPTSRWTPGQTHAEHYAVTIPATAYTPDRGRWAIGLYDHRTGTRLPVRLVSADPSLGAEVEADGLRFGAVARTRLCPARFPTRSGWTSKDHASPARTGSSGIRWWFFPR